MSIFQLIIEALESLSSNKVRAGLTMLGIIIGVASVITMLAVGAGAQSAIDQQISSIGTNLLYVAPGGDATNPQPLTTEDAQAIANPLLAPDVQYVAPVVQTQEIVSIPGESSGTSIIGVTPNYFLVQTVEVAEGQTISQAQVDRASSVVLLGSQTAEDLFKTTSGLVGKTVRMRGQVFTVIGVLKSQGGTGFGNADSRILMPLSTVQLRLVKRSAPDVVDMLYVQAASSESVPKAQEQVTQILRARHRLNLGKDDFDIMSTQSLLDTAAQITGIMTAFLGAIAGISLLVGGIGIMNIMLVTVTERTREIGLRKALGARKLDIRIQFLVESSLLSLGGGILGICLGWGIGRLISAIATATGNTLNPVIEMNSILLATMFSAAVGLFFGIYPASRAANLEPVEALRSE
jgi:putative ABC transport system permease protein